ncbi:SCO2322 family protein [Kytococcus sp. Marseille-QA3725]
MHRTRIGREAARATVAALALTAPLLTATSATADPGTRYWSTWSSTGTEWEVPEEGARTNVPADGSTVGLRYAMVPRNAEEGRSPRATPDFATACAQTPAEWGRKRVAVVVDHGRPEESATPREEGLPEVEFTCASVASDATLERTIRESVEVEGSSGAVCAVDGHPSDGCSRNRVADADPAVLEATDEPVEASPRPEDTTGGGETDGGTDEEEEDATDDPTASEPSDDATDDEAKVGDEAAGGDEDKALPGTAQDPDARPSTGALVPWYGTAALLGLIGIGLWLLLRPLPTRPDGTTSGIRTVLARRSRSSRAEAPSRPDPTAGGSTSVRDGSPDDRTR